ncbi:MAG: ACP S-malonyltransferase [Actinobacteria bacterium]|nr:MAG: ACP S-malonyltransferase [Actinomycetota bacterium]
MRRPHVTASIAIVFPGQGSQRVGMLDALPPVEGLSRLLDAAEALSDLELRAFSTFGPEEELAQTRVAQPLLYLADWAWGAAVLEAGVAPVALAGHSLGEYAALALAGVFSVEAGLELVITRSQMMAQAALETPGAMAAVIGLDGPVVADSVAGIDGVWVANDNCPGQVVISGTQDGVAAGSEALSAAGARRIVPLAVSGGFHSPLMAPAAEAFAEVLAAAEFEDARLPVVQNAEPAPATDAQVIRERLTRQIVSPVRWTETMGALAAVGADTLVEAGPGEVLTGLAKRYEGLAAVSASAAGVEAATGRVG